VGVDAVVIGSGPNGLVAATLLARAGWSVEVHERAPVAGGAVGSDRTPGGYVHDWGSAFYGVLQTSPVFEELQLGARVPWAHARSPVAAVWDTGQPAAVVEATPEATAAGLDADARAWLDLVAWWDRLGAKLIRAGLGTPGAPLPLLRAAGGLSGPRELVQTVGLLLEPVEAFVRHEFAGEAARMALACHATHGDVAVDANGSLPPSLLLGMAAQTHGMPVPVGGADALARGMVEAAQEAGVIVRTRVDVRRVVVRGGRAVGVVDATGDGTAVRRAVVADVDPFTLAHRLVGEEHLPGGWLASLSRHRRASGYFRLDVDLDRPAPWRDERLRDTAVVHVTGDLDALAMSQALVRRGRLPDEPQLIVGQQDRADPTRVPAGAASLWVECHCPARPQDAGSDWEARFAERMLDRLEQHAPGLRSSIVSTTVTPPLALQVRDPNLVGGDVGGGSMALDQLVVLRPVAGWSPYALPVRGLFLCGAGTHPGGGVHGWCGRNAAGAVLRSRWLPGR